jgi:hypothetical protein
MVDIAKPKARMLHKTWAAIVFLMVCSIVWFVLTLNSQWPTAYFLVWVLFCVAALPLLRTYALGCFDLFEPITGICVLYFIYFGIASVYELNTPLKEGRLFINIEDGVEVALLYAVLSLIALQSGYSLFNRFIHSIRWHMSVQRENWNRVFWVAVVIYTIGLGARLYGAQKGLHIRFAASLIYGQFSGIDLFYDYLCFLSTFGYVLMAAYSFVAPRPLSVRVLVWGLMLPTELFFAFLGGPKEYFLPILIVPVICYHYLRKAMPVLKMIVPIGIIGWVVFPVMTSYRSLDPTYLRRLPFWDGVQYAMSGSWDLLSQLRLLEYLRWGLELLAERMDGIYTLTGVLLNVPTSMGYQWGKTIFVGFGLLIPTFIWEGKYDYLLTVITWGERIFGVPPGTSGISITHPGELFLNFGTLGMLLGMFLLGGTFHLIHKWLVGRRHFFGIIIYAILWPTIIIPEYPIASYYSNAIKQAIILFVVSLLAGARWRQPGKQAIELRPD